MDGGVRRGAVVMMGEGVCVKFEIWGTHCNYINSTLHSK